MVDWNDCTECGRMMDWRDRGLCDRCIDKQVKLDQFEKRLEREQKAAIEDAEYQAWKRDKGYA